MKMIKNIEKLEQFIGGKSYAHTFQRIGILGTGLYAVGSLISRYCFNSDFVVNSLDIGMFAGMGYTLGASLVRYGCGCDFGGNENE